MAACGADAATIAEWTAPASDGDGGDEDEPCEIWADVMPAVDLFLACDSQWRFAAHVPVALDYAAVRVIADALAVALTPRLVGDLRTLEIEAGAALRRRQK